MWASFRREPNVNIPAICWPMFLASQNIFMLTDRLILHEEFIFQSAKFICYHKVSYFISLTSSRYRRLNILKLISKKFFKHLSHYISLLGVAWLGMTISYIGFAQLLISCFVLRKTVKELTPWCTAAYCWRG